MFNSGSHARHLYGLRLLVVEDEALVAMMLEDMLADLGCIVTGVAGSVAQALRILARNGGLDAAILDVNLGGQKIYPVADLLVEREVPFVFCTGYGPLDLMTRYPMSQVLSKPYLPEALASVLAECCRNPAPHLRS